MDTAGVFECPEDGTNSEKCQMWLITWDRINAFLPGLKEELFKQSAPPKAPPPLEEGVEQPPQQPPSLDNKETDTVAKSNCENWDFSFALGWQNICYSSFYPFLLDVQLCIFVWGGEMGRFTSNLNEKFSFKTLSKSNKIIEESEKNNDSPFLKKIW